MIGLKCHYVFASDIEEARLLVAINKGIIPVEYSKKYVNHQDNIIAIPLQKNGKQIQRNYCAFWPKEKTNYYIEEFAEILRNKMRESHENNY